MDKKKERVGRKARGYEAIQVNSWLPKSLVIAINEEVRTSPDIRDRTMFLQFAAIKYLNARRKIRDLNLKTSEEDSNASL
jgi:hypothetical protein